MATIATRLGFSIHSTYNGHGAAQAVRSLITVRTAASAMDTSMRRASSGMGLVTTAAAALAPAMAPIGTVAAGVGAATLAMGVSAGSAMGIYGAAMAGAIQRTLQMRDAGAQLDGSQRLFIGTLDQMRAAWDRFIIATSPTTLLAASVALQGVTAIINGLKPVVDAMAPAVLRVAEAFRNWATGTGFQQFIATVISTGVPAMNSLINAGRDVLAVLGIAFRTLAPLGVEVAQALERGAAALRLWAEGGGFTRFLESVRANAPQVREFFIALLDALQRIGQAMAGLGPLALGLATAFLQLIASLPIPVLQALIIAFVAWRTAMLGLFIVSTLTTLMHGLHTALVIVRAVTLSFFATLMAHPIILIIAAIAALVAAIVFLATQTQFFQTVWSAVWGFVRDVGLAIWSALQTAWSAFVNSLTVVWNAVSGALTAAWSAVWNAISLVATAIWSALTAAWSAFINSLATVWNAVSGALTAAWSAVWNAMSTVASAIWTALTAAWSAFINGLAAVWSAVSGALSAAWSAVWNAISAVAQAIWAALGAAWNAFIGVFLAAWNAASAFLGAAWGAFWNNILAFGQFVWNAISAAWSALWAFVTGVWNAFAGFLGAAWGAFWENVRAFAQFIWDTLSQMWVSWTNFISSIWGAFSSFLGAAWGAFWEAIRAFAQFIWDTLSQMWVSWTNFISSVWTAFSGFLGAAWGAFWEAIRAFAQFIWDTLSQMWVAWTNFIRAIWDGFSSALGIAWGAFWEAIRAFGQFIWNSMSDAWNTFLNLVRSIYDFFSTSLGDAWGAFWNNILAFVRFIWDEITGVVRGAVNVVIGIVNGLIRGFNNVAGFLNIGISIGEIPTLANGGVIPGGQGTGTFGPGGNNFRKGGVVNGYSPGRDTVPAMLSPGEGVLTPEAVRGLGGPGFVHSANRHWAGHRGAGRGARGLGKFEGGTGYATGGMVPGGSSLPLGAIQAMAMGGITLAALARAGLGGVQIIQPEFNVGVAASAGTHDGGGVVDLPANQGILNALLATGEWAAWMRGPADGMTPHIHAVLMSHPQLSGAAAAQVQSFLAGGSGLGVGGGGGGGNPLAGIFGSVVSKLGEVLLNVAQGLNPFDGIDIPGLGGGGGGGILGSGIGPDVGPDLVPGDGLADLPIIGAGIDFASAAIDGLLGGLFGAIRPFLLSAVTRPILDTAFSFIDWVVPDGLGGGAGEIAIGMGKWFMDKIVKEFILGKAATAPKMPMGGGGAMGDPASVQQWAGLAAQALAMAGINPSQLNAFLALMAAESGGNPMAINNTDINAQNGIPSQGLMQVIPPTFAAYRDPSLPNNILDPLANMVAAARYIMARYGGQVPGSPYAMGTNNARRGWHLVGERGPEMMSFRGGEQVRNFRATQRMMSVRGGDGAAIFEKGCFQIDARGATVDAVREMENNLVPKLRQAVQAGVGRK